jgi:hypothetical protein
MSASSRAAISRLTLVLVSLLAVPAIAAEVTTAPTISGDPTLGALQEATTGAWTPAGAAPSYAWLRCGSGGDSCTPIDAACSRRYRAAEADGTHTLRIRLTVADDGAAAASVTSLPTAVITSPIYSIPGTPVRDTCSDITPTGPKTGTFDSGTQAEPITPAPAGSTATPFISPFPVVRISGRFTRKRTTITRVAIRAPRGVRVGLRCRGTSRGCTFKRRAIAVRLVHARSLQRRFRPGAIMEIRVTQSGHIGKYVKLRIRSGRAPVRIDRCLSPGKRRPVRCPAS